jgi:hypothetical protein
MFHTRRPRTSIRSLGLAFVMATTLTVTGCADGTDAAGDDQAGSAQDDESSDADEATGGESSLAAGAVGSLRSDEPHQIELEYDDDAYLVMLATYVATGEKDWIEATVTIDGTSYENVGLRLKGNSSLRQVGSSDDPETLPWLIKLDEFVDGQQHDGLTDLVVRSNNSDTSLNEAVALELLELAELPSQDAVAVALTVNGSEPELRLVIDNPDDVWMSENLDADGALYKAESSGDYSYRGDDPDSYDEVFDQEAGKDNADLTPLIEFLDFINNADDLAFEAELRDWLDIDAFTTYLAMQELLANFDDIDGPGNNSYLYYDPQTDRFTVVPWDHNLAFGVSPGGAGGRGVPPGGFDEDVNRAGPGGEDGGFGGGARGGFGGSNILVQRFLDDPEWQAAYADRPEALRGELFDSGVADSVLADWGQVVASIGLVDDEIIATESAQIAGQFD